MEEKTLTCINCPLGCSLLAKMEHGQVVSVSGNTCRRGDVYARKELTNPTRIVTSTVFVTGKTASMVSVKTRQDIPKEKVFACMDALRNLTVKAPVQIGDVLLANVADTGIDIIATKNVE